MLGKLNIYLNAWPKQGIASRETPEVLGRLNKCVHGKTFLQQSPESWFYEASSARGLFFLRLSKACMHNSMSPQIWVSSQARLPQSCVQGTHMATACPALCHQAWATNQGQPPGYSLLLWTLGTAGRDTATFPCDYLKKMKPRFVFISQAQYRKKIIYLGKYKRSWITLSGFLFPNCQIDSLYMSTSRCNF